LQVFNFRLRASSPMNRSKACVPEASLFVCSGSMAQG